MHSGPTDYVKYELGTTVILWGLGIGLTGGFIYVYLIKDLL